MVVHTTVELKDIRIDGFMRGCIRLTNLLREKDIVPIGERVEYLFIGQDFFLLQSDFGAGQSSFK